MKSPALFKLLVAISLGCTIICGCQHPPEDGAGELYRKYFEAGRRSEAQGNIKIAGDSYEYLIKCGSFYGEYGLAQLQLRRGPGSREAVKNLLPCAQRTSDVSDLFPVSVEEAAFSVAAMASLSEIAVSEHDRQDIADWLRYKMSNVVTDKVRIWAREMKSDPDTKAIYEDIITAVESSRKSREYVSEMKWTEIGKVLAGGGGSGAGQSGVNGTSPASHYSVVKFEKTPNAACQYEFEVQMAGVVTFESAGKVRSAIRRQLVKEFLDANPHDDVRDIRTSILTWNQQQSTIKGSVAVMKVSAVRLEYNALTRRGKIAVRLDGRDIAAARKWAKENISELVTDKNIELVVGKPPPQGASFETGSERMLDGGLLEIEFKAQE